MLLRISVYTREIRALDGKTPWIRRKGGEEVELPQGRGRIITVGPGNCDVNIDSEHLRGQLPIRLFANTAGKLSVYNPFKFDMLHVHETDENVIKTTITSKTVKCIGKIELGETFRILVGDVKEKTRPLELQVRVDDKPALK